MRQDTHKTDFDTLTSIIHIHVGSNAVQIPQYYKIFVNYICNIEPLLNKPDQNSQNKIIVVVNKRWRHLERRLAQGASRLVRSRKPLVQAC